MRPATPALLLASLTACAATGGARDTEADMQAIRGLATRFAAGFVAGEPDAVARCITEDFVALTPGEPALAGRDAARVKIAADLARMEVRELRFEIEELHVAGDWAWARASSHAEVVLRGTGDLGRIRGKTLWIFRRGADGAWRIARDSSSGDEG